MSEERQEEQDEKGERGSTQPRLVSSAFEASLIDCGLHWPELYTELVDKVNNYFRKLNLEAAVSQ